MIPPATATKRADGSDGSMVMNRRASNTVTGPVPASPPTTGNDAMAAII